MNDTLLPCGCVALLVKAAIFIMILSFIVDILNG